MNTGLVLSGGGARGILHLGVIQGLEELGYKFTQLAGASAGSIVGSLYGYGYSPKDILKIVSTTSFFKAVRPSWSLTGFLSLDKLHDVLLNYMPQNDFSALKIPMTICATEIRRGESVYFTSGELIKPILASCCVPAIFNPIQFGGSVYVDGGILDNLPARSIRDKCDFLVGSHCNHIGEEFDIRNIKVVIERSVLMAINSNTNASAKLCDLFIEPPEAGKISGYELAKANDLFQIGYQHTLQNVKPSILKQQSHA